MWVIEFAGQSRYLYQFERQSYAFGDYNDAIYYWGFAEVCVALRELVRIFPELLNTAHISPL